MERAKSSGVVKGYIRCPGCGALLPLDEFAAALLCHPIYINNPNVHILCPAIFPKSAKVKIPEGKKTAQEVRV